MNHTTAEIRPTLYVSEKIHNQRSLVSRIISNFTKGMKSLSIGERAAYHHKSFIEENLLDVNIGHEISRTLRR